ncbi:MAG: type ISP restriction/modification enzyme [Thermodesulfobacteriota bacterium]
MELFKAYILSLQKALAAGDATEHTHRPPLKTLLESLQDGIRATNEPRADVASCGKPDMRVSRGAVPVGYLETKDIGKNLDTEEKGEQIKRYLKGLPNFILTDYLEFRWYVNGERRAKAVMGRLGAGGKIKAGKDDITAVGELLEQFLALKTPTIGTAKDLALRMAGLAHIIRGAALLTLENEPETGTLKGWQTAFEKTLLPHLTASEFADMYAQTLTYGLFAADVTADTGVELRRDTAASLLPATNPLLRKLFHHLAGLEVPDAVAWAVDDMVALLNATDMAAVLEDFGKGSLEKDPVVHFYETFLAAYDPERRKARGVYYTPEPVVSYIVRAIDHLLKERFGRPWGLADKNTLILDPACGTGTFLHSVMALIYDTLSAQGQAGGWKGEKGYVSENLLPRLFGFELLMAPYAVAHLKLGLLLKERGYDFPPGGRLGVYLTNTLEEGIKLAEVLPLAGFITEESNAAAQVKKEDPIEVVLGNPPYAGHSANASLRREVDPTGKTRTVRTWIGRLLEDYKRVDGQPLGEKNPKWLQDDYVKFLRWGQWRIDRTGRGILAMITNHGYLDNPTFRGMRRQLMQTFNEIYLFNLHGNAKKKEVCPDGSKDENVFDIQQGVAIGVFVKIPGEPGPTRVYHADLWGLREKKKEGEPDGKYEALAQLELGTTPWQELQPSSPSYLFVPQAIDLRVEYERGWPVQEIFPVNSVGIVTARDHLTIRWSKEDVWEQVKDFATLPEEEAREKYNLGDDARDWKVRLAQADIKDKGPKGKDRGPDRKKIVPILYRPFDVRFTYYTGQSRGFICMPRPEVMVHMLAGENLGLCFHRREEVQGPYSHFLVTRYISEHGLLSSKTTNSQAPLYLYSCQSRRNNNSGTQNSILALCEPSAPYGKKPNIEISFLEKIESNLIFNFIPNGRGDLESTFGPEDVVSYAYAVFHSPTYRQRYSEFLKMDFPRLPLTGNKALFAVLVGLGAELVTLHLLESPALDRLITRFPVVGSQVVDKVHYDEKNGRVYINPDQYFEGVPSDAWAFQVGGYQVLHKWLKDRKGRQLSFDDLHHYQKVVKALTETIRLMAAIDAAIDAHGGWPLNDGDSNGKI